MAEDSSRKFDYFIDHPFVKTDTTIFILPVGVTS
jgi:hypothetical protein